MNRALSYPEFATQDTRSCPDWRASDSYGNVTRVLKIQKLSVGY